MSDIFISYASEDRDLAKQLAHTLENQGWSVWWDRKIPFGKIYDEVIAENLAAARCVIVLWTRHSVNSQWVRTEALEAFERNALIPILMDEGIKIPLQFKLLQTAHLLDWQPGDIAHPEFAQVLTHIQERCAVAPSTVADKSNAIIDAQPEPRPKRYDNAADIAAPAASNRGGKFSFNKSALTILGTIVCLSLLAGSIAYFMMNQRVATRIQAKLTVDRVELTLNEAIRLPSIDFMAAQFEYFSQLAFSPSKLEVMTTSPAKTKVNSVNFIKSLQVNDQVILQGKKPKSPKISIHPLTEANKPTGSLKEITIPPGTTLTFSTPRAASHKYTIEFSGDDLALTPHITPTGPFKLVAAENVYLPDGTPLKFNKKPSVDLQVTLGDSSNPFVVVTSAAHRFIVTLTLAGLSNDEPLVTPGSAISNIEFWKQGPNGKPESTLIAPGTISYVEFAQIPAVTLAAHDALALNDLHDVTIQEFYYDPQQNGFELRLIGQVDKVAQQTGKWANDLRLTAFDKFWHDQRLVLIFSIIVWVGSVVFGAYKIYQEVKKHA